MIEIQLLNKKLLREYIHSEEFESQEFIPISRHRAWSQINNPRADEDDILLLLAHEGEQMVGYLGVLPDWVFYKSQFERCGWMSCIWVDDRHRGKKIALQLVQKCLEVWDNRILATEFTAPAKKLYDKTKAFNDFNKKTGIRLYLRADLLTILPPKKQFFQKSKFLLKTFDSIFNFFFDCRYWFYEKKLSQLQLEYTNHLDQEVENFLNDKQQKQFFKRRVNELNWAIKNPWILSAPAKDSLSKKYHFSSLEKSFTCLPLKVKNLNNELLAFMIFVKRNDSLKLPYCYYTFDIETIVEVINYHLVKWKIKTFTTFHRDITHYLKNSRSIALHKKELEREYIFSNHFDKSLLDADFEIEDGDGDCFFT